MKQARAGGTGALVVSLDFELYWGVRDKRSLAGYGPNIMGARQAIPRMLDAFARYGIHATWATVGFLFLSGREELMASLPSVLPRYRDPGLSPYSSIPNLGDDERSDPYHFAPSIIRTIAAAPGQEIATHTFSHYYCLEPGQDREAFRCDMEAAVRAAAKSGLSLKSLVFPRNQINAEYLGIAWDAGIRAFRGNPCSWMYAAGEEGRESAVRRLARLADAYLPISGHHAYPVAGPAANVPCDFAASRFLRPYQPRLRSVESYRLRRILTGLTFAAQHGLVYHLWWHPHNFGRNPEANLAILEAICRHVSHLRETLGFECLGMGELSDRVLG
jgi:peptidoglycan/xylan/chitin deacetylase (PgdA/CDA1 family)